MNERIRRLSYLSESVSASEDGVPSELASIVIKSRRFNHAHQITGFLTFREGYFFQTIEGPCDAVEALFDKISQDHRHARIQKIWDDENSSERMFSGWKLKLSHSSVSCEEVNHFLRCNQQRYHSLEKASRDILGRLFQVDLVFSSEDGGGMPPLHQLGSYEFRLQALPIHSAFGQSQIANVEIFSALLSDWCNVDELTCRFGLREEELYRLLSGKRVQPLLLTRQLSHRDNGDHHNLGHDDDHSSTGHRSFYQGLRSFFMTSRG